MPSGSCWCGNLKYEVSGEPVQKALCHCLTCRKITGSASSLIAILNRSTFTVTSGNPKTFSKPHENKMLEKITFCPTCGTTIYRELGAVAVEGMAILQSGTLDGGSEALDSFGPLVEMWVRHRPQWLPQLAGVEQMQEFQ